MQELQNAVRQRNQQEVDPSAPDKVAVSNAVDPNRLLDLSTARTFKTPLKEPSLTNNTGSGKGVNQRAYELGELAAAQGGDVDPEKLLLLKNSMVEEYKGPSTTRELKTNPSSPHTVTADELKQAQAEATGIPYPQKNAQGIELAQGMSNATPQAISIAQGNSIPLSEEQRNAMASNITNLIELSDRQLNKAFDFTPPVRYESTRETVADTHQLIKDFAARSKRESQVSLQVA